MSATFVTPTPGNVTKDVSGKKPGPKPRKQNEGSVRYFTGKIEGGLPKLENEYSDELDALIYANANKSNLMYLQVFTTEVQRVDGSAQIVKVPVAKK